MKKMLLTVMPSLLIFTLVFIDHFVFSEGSYYIIIWLYLGFPIAFILQGIISSNSKVNLAVGFLVSSIMIIIPISLWYNLQGVSGVILIYIMLGWTSSVAFRRIKEIKGKKK